MSVFGNENDFACCLPLSSSQPSLRAVSTKLLNCSSFCLPVIMGGKSTVHPIRGDELRALRKLHRETNGGKFIFMTERTDDGGRAQQTGQAPRQRVKAVRNMLAKSRKF
jgi:hypothetical protein